MQARVEAAAGSEEVAARIAARLKEERGRLEERVTKQLGMERRLLLERKRREDAERRQQQEEMERILEENKRKVGGAANRAAQCSVRHGAVHCGIGAIKYSSGLQGQVALLWGLGSGAEWALANQRNVRAQCCCPPARTCCLIAG